MGFLDASGVTKLVTELRSRFAAIGHTHTPASIGAVSTSDYRGKQTWGNLAGTTTWGELLGTQVTTSQTTTTNYSLVKPGYDDTTDIDPVNDDMDAIDGRLYADAQAISTLASEVGSVNVGTSGSLQSQVNSLRDSVYTPAVHTLTPEQTGITVNYGGYVKMGNIVIISVCISTSSATSRAAVLSGLPSESSPKNHGLSASDATYVVYGCRIYGERVFCDAIPASTTVVIEGAYFLS